MRTLLLVCLLLCASLAVAEEPRVLSGEQSAAEFKSLRLDAGVGEVRVKAHEADVVRWKVELEAERDGLFSSLKDAREAIAAARVEAEIAGSRLILGAEFPAGTDEDEIREHWEVLVPVRLAVDVDMAVGELHLDGMAGGVDADLAVGELRIRVPRGRIRADVSVGEIEIDTATESPGDIELEANVGDVSLDLKGYRVPDEHDFGPGAEINLAKDGGDDIEASVNVGDVRVKVR